MGGGISGVACARRLHAEGHPVRILERSHRLGGRMAVRTEQLPSGPHPVDIGAPYFTVRGEGFGAVVDGWQGRGLARPWTDTFSLAGPGGQTGSTTGPERWSAPRGLRSLVQDLAHGLDVRFGEEVTRVELDPDDVPHVDGVPAAAVVLAMPDPQAARLLAPDLAGRLGVTDQAWSPALTVWAAWQQRWWAPFDGAYVDGSDTIAWVADDGSSRGDDAPVLVVHSTGDFAAARLDDVASAIAPILADLRGVLGAGPMPEPVWTRVHRWSLASARHPHEAPFALDPAGIGVCGDGWGPRSRVEQAWTSGDALGQELSRRFASSSRVG